MTPVLIGYPVLCLMQKAVWREILIIVSVRMGKPKQLQTTQASHINKLVIVTSQITINSKGVASAIIFSYIDYMD